MHTLFNLEVKSGSKWLQRQWLTQRTWDERKKKGGSTFDVLLDCFWCFFGLRLYSSTGHISGSGRWKTEFFFYNLVKFFVLWGSFDWMGQMSQHFDQWILQSWMTTFYTWFAEISFLAFGILKMLDPSFLAYFGRLKYRIVVNWFIIMIVQMTENEYLWWKIFIISLKLRFS